MVYFQGERSVESWNLLHYFIDEEQRLKKPGDKIVCSSIRGEVGVEIGQ